MWLNFWFVFSVIYITLNCNLYKVDFWLKILNICRRKLMQIFHIFIDPLASCCSFLVARSVGPFVAQIDTDAAQSVPQLQLNFLHHYHTNSPNYSNFSYPPYNSLMESLLRNVCVPPLTSRQMAIVFTRRVSPLDLELAFAISKIIMMASYFNASCKEIRVYVNKFSCDVQMTKLQNGDNLIARR